MQTVLICGMASEAFMSDLLREMDHGPSALPAGSSLTLFNSSSTPETVARVKQRNRCAPCFKSSFPLSFAPANPFPPRMFLLSIILRAQSGAAESNLMEGRR